MASIRSQLDLAPHPSSHPTTTNPSIMTAVDFQDIEAPAPTLESVTEEYRQINAQLDGAINDGATNNDECSQAIEAWDRLCRRLDSWASLVGLRFNQDTTNQEYRVARDYRDGIMPKLTDLEVEFKRRLSAKPLADLIAKRFGPQVLALWEADILSFDPIIQDDMVSESKLEAEYTELDASAELSFQGEKFNLSGITKFLQQADREVRHGADAVRWNWYQENGTVLDRIYDELVHLRTEMATKLGFKNFVELGYKRMQRVDYNQHDVERFRAAVREDVVPLATEIRRRQAQRLGLDKLMAWDEPVHDLQGNPAPQGDHDWMLERATEMFDAMGSELSEFFRMMKECHLLDLKMRPSKAGGGFCTSFADYGLPFIFANFNGTKGDVEVFTHEMGHAFQCYMSRDLPLYDYLWPTYESCEIHSMSLEFLTWPQMEKFFGDGSSENGEASGNSASSDNASSDNGAERFRNIHLTESLMFLPYGVAVDHFQHLVYAEPDATPERRHAMWKEMEATYLPWRDWGDLTYPGQGGRWQAQRHIYLSPFYYIDYTLAQTCALQFWVRGEEDFPEAMQAYLALCKRGGEAPFQELVRGAGLISPFDDGCLTNVVAKAREALKV